MEDKRRAHRIRQAKGVSESSRPEVVACGLWALYEFQRLCHMAEEPPDKGGWNAFYGRLTRLFKRQNDRKDDVGAFVRHLMRESGVSPAGNHAEPVLRFPVIWRKRGFSTRTKQEEDVVERLLPLRQTCRLRGKQTSPRLTEAFEHYSSGDKPVALFADEREARRGVLPAHSLLSLSLSLSLSLKLY